MLTSPVDSVSRQAVGCLEGKDRLMMVMMVMMMVMMMMVVMMMMMQEWRVLAGCRTMRLCCCPG
jgi:hypothetical protein